MATAGVIDWAVEKPLLRKELGADFEALLKQYAAGAVGGANDGAKPALVLPVPAAMKQEQPVAWLESAIKDLGSAWATGPAKGEVLAPGANGKWGFTPVAALVTGTATMGAGALLSPIEGPLNGIYNKLPIGSIVLGGGSAMLLGLAIDELYPHTATAMNTTNLAIKGGLALALTMFGTKIFSSTGALVAAAVFGLQVVADLGHKQVDSIVAWLVKTWNQITGKTTVAQRNYIPARQPARTMGAGDWRPADNHPLVAQNVRVSTVRTSAIPKSSET